MTDDYRSHEVVHGPHGRAAFESRRAASQSSAGSPGDCTRSRIPDHRHGLEAVSADDRDLVRPRVREAGAWSDLLHHAWQDFSERATWCRIENRNLIGTVPETDDNHSRDF